PHGFWRRALPRHAITLDAGRGDRVTRNWVVALDLVFQHQANTGVGGTLPPTPGAAERPAWRSDSGSAYSFAVAPAIEYNWTSRLGVLVGVSIIAAGRNAAASVTPALAVNMVH